MKNWEISWEMYRELLYFCRQYDDKKTASAWEPDGNKAQRMKRDADTIEAAAREAAKELDGYLLRHVTRGVPYACLGVPCGKNQFGQMRRKFYFLLAQKRGMI